MTKLELQKYLKENIRDDAYSFIGDKSNEQYVLEKVDGIWEVYYSERGLKSELVNFINEDDACDYFYKYLSSNSDTKR